MTQVSTLLPQEATGFSAPAALLVGMHGDELPARRGHLRQVETETLPYVLLHAALACAPLTEHVISPLVSEHFDAMDLAAELECAGFSGIYTVIVPPLPRPDIVLREMRQIAPSLHIDLMTRTVC